MGVIEDAGAVIAKGPKDICLPQGTKRVLAKGNSSGWFVVFETDGPYLSHQMRVESMERAIKLAARLSRLLPEAVGGPRRQVDAHRLQEPSGGSDGGEQPG